MSQIRQQANAVLNAMDAARVGAILTLIDHQRLPLNTAKTERENVVEFCELVGVQDIDYWLEFFGVT
jgi:hypothetical protein